MPHRCRERQRMIERYVPLADKLARRYSHTSEPLEDLMQVARLGLIKAVDRWDPDRGNRFTTFAVPTITGEIQRYFRDRAWAIRPPRDLQELYVRVQRTRAAVSTELGREPSARDVAQAIGCDTEDVVEAFAARDAYAPQSLDAPFHTDEDDSYTRLDQLADTRHEIRRAEDVTTLRQLTRMLDDRSQEVVRLRYEEDLLQRQIADRVGCSQMHVSRILRDAMVRMRETADETDVIFG